MIIGFGWTEIRTWRDLEALTPTCVRVDDGGRRWLAAMREELTTPPDLEEMKAGITLAPPPPVTADLPFTAGGTKGPRTPIPSPPAPPPPTAPPASPARCICRPPLQVITD